MCHLDIQKIFVALVNSQSLNTMINNTVRLINAIYLKVLINQHKQIFKCKKLSDEEMSISFIKLSNAICICSMLKFINISASDLVVNFMTIKGFKGRYILRKLRPTLEGITGKWHRSHHIGPKIGHSHVTSKSQLIVPTLQLYVRRKTESTIRMYHYVH